MTKPLSPFAMRSEFYFDNNLIVLPIEPGTKKPGQYSNGAWTGMNGWNKYFTSKPANYDINRWQSWPDAGIGLLLGKLNGIIAVDVDTEDPVLLGLLAKLLPPSPVRKKGRKGYTSFYRHTDAHVNRAWNVKKDRVVDLLVEGRQTLMPGTLHPDGMSYIYLTEDTLEDFDVALLPELPASFTEDLDALLLPWQTPDDVAARRKPATMREEDPASAGMRTIAQMFFREINQQALNRLDDWVPHMIPGAKTKGDGYRCRAFWRNAENPNVGIHHTGIFDFGGNIPLTPIDLVMYAQNAPLNAAAEALQGILGLGGNSVEITVNAKAAATTPPRPDEPAVDLSKLLASKPKPAAAPAPVLMPRADADPMAAALERRELQKSEESEARRALVPEFIANAPGIIGTIADWINATAPKAQPEFAVAAALAIGSTAMGRKYRSNTNNFTALWFMLVAESGEGKDHPQKAIRSILAKAGQEQLIGGSGYTSAAGVFSALVARPSHVAIIDEFGQLLKSSGQAGSQNTDSALVKLMEVFTNLDDMIVPQQYSTMGLSKKDAVAIERKVVYNPSVVQVAATTPGVLFKAISGDHIEGGMFGRYILIQSNQPLQLSVMPEYVDPPESVLEWVKQVVDEHAAGGDLKDLEDSALPAKAVPMQFAPDCFPLMREFDAQILDKKRSLDDAANIALLGRTAEKAMRMAMIVAKATNAPRDNLIRAEALAWAIKYVKHYDWAMVTAIETKRPQTKFELHYGRLKDIISRAKEFKSKEYGRVLAEGAMPRAVAMSKMKLMKAEFDQVVETAISAGFIFKQAGLPSAGFAGEVYFMRGEAD